MAITKNFLSYTKAQIQSLLDRVFHLDFLVDVTEAEYEALSPEQKRNGSLYLIPEEDGEEEE